ncbi:MAG: DUF5011 domain-containing protein [Candidatus Nomurabacteria bacterium]|nr:DUF5011 domain-containing protein [Candidatus Nomurabacteria bacterium]
MKNKKLFILGFSLLFSLLSLTANAEGVCSKSGYTILTINGIFTDKEGALNNKDSLQRSLGAGFKNEPLNVDYVYNPTHAQGFIDVLDTIAQGYLNQKSDYDLVEMLNNASTKVKTEKLLLVGHSQGNFYANNFYDKVADMEGGVPKQSIGVYSVATPASRVAGDGLYLTSDTDKVIAKLVGSAKKIMPPNTHISYTNNEDIWGHDFYKIYLAHNGDRIIGDLKTSLDKLKTNDIQSSNTPCLSPVKISLAHKITGAMLAVTDFSANTIINSVKQTVTLAYNLSKKATILVGENLANIASKNLAFAGSSIMAGPLFSISDQSLNNTQFSNMQVLEGVENNIQENTNLDTNIPVVTDTNVEETNLNPTPTDIEPVSTTPDSGVSSGGSSNGGGSNDSGENSDDNPTEDNKDDKVEDKTAPVITLVGESVINIEVGSTYVDAGATALDDIDEVVEVVSSGIVDNIKAGVYTITYTATDKAENVATLNRTINVIAPNIKDTTAPVITLNGESSVNIELNTTYVDAGATATDDIDGVVEVVTTGIVDNTKVGIYTLTYTATDKALNISTLTRIVEVSQPAMALSFPPASMTTSGDGVYPNSAKRKIEEFLYQIVYTSKDNTPPYSVTLRRKNLKTGVYLNDQQMNTINNSSNRVWPAELRDGNYANGELYSVSNSVDDEGEYEYYFVIVDKDFNIVKKFGENNNLKITATPATNYYPSKASFGTENGDGKNWQVWIFDKSNIYDWSDTYINNYLHQHFKVQNYDYISGGVLRLDLFSSDPRNGFEPGDITTGGVSEYRLPVDPLSLPASTLHDVDIQWDSTGYNYTYTLASNASVASTGHVNITNISNNLWIGWGIYNPKVYWAASVYAPFFESVWVGAPSQFAEGRTGGKYVYPAPSPIYKVHTEPVKSGEKLINTFDFQNLSPVVNGVVDNTNHTINLTVPYGTNISSMTPIITISDKSTIAPQSGVAKDFTNNVTYTVTAEDGTTQSYIVTVTVLPNPNPDDPDSTPPTLRSYALNNTQSNITINPVTSNLTISLRANKKVNWLSIKIIKTDNEDVSKLYQSDTKNCRDGENSCEKLWDKGELTHGILQNGNYKIRVRLEDTSGKIYEEYLPYIITVIGQS